VVLLTLLFPGSGSDAGAYVGKWIRDGLGSLGPARVVFLLFASYGSLWLLLPRGLVQLPAHLRRAALVYLLAAVALPLVGSPERMEEAIFPLLVTCAVLAARTARPLILWALALANLLFVARIGGDASIPSVVAWAGLALACGLALWIVARPHAVLRPARGAI
jgi:succinate-acetate transporter protein